MPKQRRQNPQTQTLTFVVEAPSEKPGKDNQRLVRSHAARVNRSRDDEKEFKSWMLRKKDTSTALQIPDGSIPGRVGSNLSLLDFPEPLQPYMENDIFRFDQVYFHSVIFSTEAYFDMILGREHGSLSQFHFLKTVRLLQERLSNPQDSKAISDATIMVVVTLGLVAELIGDRAAAESHVAGMARIINLRGGLEMLRYDNPRLPAKVCRVDLGLALRFGSRPIFFNDDISWNPYISSKNLIRGMKKAAKRNGVIATFIKTLDPRLSNVWKDLDEFATLSNLASQTGRKLQPNTFSEIMVSILYRLLALSYPESPLANALRLGVMTFSATIFFRWREMKQRQIYLDDSFKGALLELKKSPVQPPSALLLWLLVLWKTTGGNGPSDNVFSGWTCEVIRGLGIESWAGMRDVLKTVLWIDCLFDTPSRHIFEPILVKTSETILEKHDV
ncbi:hypothetical protein FHETE_1679 [Fusarium heterosporum]|uniref:Uncharacterized protein n=1 Tax=Fusarium heterosporum TaxID=42747 RepID=A0A8H5X142_FUSHE|nr:hypothetical protein FHETE_1679 [Fusarium heterosporum]